ncbi:MAG: universal stress protein [Pseudomonadota bacterium]
MVSKRLVNEEGHKRKFLCVVDGTTECEKAVLYAERRATKVGGGLTLLYVSEPESFQHWIGVEEIMKAEARENGEAALHKYAQFSREHGSIDPELVYREGKTIEELQSLIEEDQDIAALVLAAGDGADGSGPLVGALSANGGTYPIPVIVVPGAMTFEDIDSVT